MVGFIVVHLARGVDDGVNHGIERENAAPPEKRASVLREFEHGDGGAGRVVGRGRCVCVCVRERARKSEGERDGGKRKEGGSEGGRKTEVRSE